MRKIFALVIALTLLTVPLYAAVAAGVDLSGMTDEELTALKQQLDAEMLDRGMVKTAVLPIGPYTVGVDIPKGEYEFCKANDNDAENGYLIFANETDYKNVAKAVETYTFTNGTPKKVALEDGQILFIGLGAMRVTAFGGIQWQ